MESEKSQLRSGITAPFNKSLNEALQFSPQMPFNIENTVTPSQLIAVLKGEQGTPGLPAAVSAVKDDNNLMMLAVSPIERGILKVVTGTVTFSGVAPFTASINFTVPNNKKWSLKSTGLMFSNTATISWRQLSLVTPISSDPHYLIFQSTNATGIRYIDDLKFNNLLISSGTVLTAAWRVTANTDGTAEAILLVNEMDI